MVQVANIDSEIDSFPIRARIRPQLGDSPWMAVLIKGLVIMAFAIASACFEFSAPLTFFQVFFPVVPENMHAIIVSTLDTRCKPT